MTAILISGGIDLSVGSMTALVACVMATFEPGRQFWFTAVPMGLAVGAGLGLFNGLLVAGFDVPPIIATLGTLFFYRGLCDAVLKGTKPSPFIDVPGYFRLGELAGVLVLIVASYLGSGGGWFRWSRWRREILMIGGNRVAARYAAIPRQSPTHRNLYVERNSGLCGRRVFHGPRRLGKCRLLQRAGAASHRRGRAGRNLQSTEGVDHCSDRSMGVLLVAVLAEGLRAGGSVYWIQEKLPFKFNESAVRAPRALCLLTGVWVNTRFGRSAERPLD
jgi:hypothetical protein